MCTDVAESKYMQTVPIGHRKEFAQFFTPVEIAQFMSRWILQNGSAQSILEPAFGLGIFSRALLETKTDLQITGYDIDPTIFKYAQSLFSSQQNVSLVLQDYLQSDWSKKYDGIICNPPYLKFHDYDNATATTLIKDKLGYSLSGFTNLYAIFLLKSINQLKDNGRCAYIVPSEFMNSDYGVAVKNYLIESKKLRHIIVFDFEKDVFEDAITTACIILCSNDPANESVSFSCIKTENQLYELEESLYSTTSYSISNDIPYSAIDQSIKWRKYYTESEKQSFHHLVPFAAFAKVSRGIATGANNYFSFSQKKAKEFNIPESSLLPCVCHCTDIKGHFFDDTDFDRLRDENKSVYLFNGQINSEDENVCRYIQLGEKDGVDKKYLTASRSPWYALEKRLPPHIWVTVFNREGLRFIRNTSRATNLTTFHSIYINDSHKEYVDLLYAYLLTNTAHQIFDENRREYGNGLKKFEPNDLNSGKILDISIISKQDQKRILDYLKQYKNGDMEAIDKIDKIVHDYVSSPNKTEMVIEDKGISCSVILEQYPNAIVNNTSADEDGLDFTKNLLVSLVKADNFEFFLDGSAKSYYTGKKFPSTIALNKLYYFMPYMKGLGVRDLYLIKIARVGTKTEAHPECDDNDFRLVFEIEFVKQLFSDYKMVHLDIWQTFKDTTLEQMLES